MQTWDPAATKDPFPDAGTYISGPYRMKRGRNRVPIEDRFWPKVLQGPACWAWTGATNGRYGVLGRGGRGAGMVYAHRLAWELTYGPIPEGLEVCHRCDTPLCVRPDHLFLGTRADNMQDCIRKGRWNEGSRASKGEKNGRCKLTDEQVADLRSLRTEGWTYKRLSERFGIGRTQVSRLVRGEQRAA